MCNLVGRHTSFRCQPGKLNQPNSTVRILNIIQCTHLHSRHVTFHGIHVCAYINNFHSRAHGHFIHIAFYLMKIGPDTFQYDATGQQPPRPGKGLRVYTSRATLEPLLNRFYTGDKTMQSMTEQMKQFDYYKPNSTNRTQWPIQGEARAPSLGKPKNVKGPHQRQIAGTTLPTLNRAGFWRPRKRKFCYYPPPPPH